MDENLPQGHEIQTMELNNIVIDDLQDNGRTVIVKTINDQDKQILYVFEANEEGNKLIKIDDSFYQSN